MLRIICFWRRNSDLKNLPVGVLEDWLKFDWLTGPLDQTTAKSQTLELHCLFVLGYTNWVWSLHVPSQDAIVANEGVFAWNPLRKPNIYVYILHAYICLTHQVSKGLRVSKT